MNLHFCGLRGSDYLPLLNGHTRSSFSPIGDWLVPAWRPQKSFETRIAMPTVATIILVALVVGALLSWSTTQADLIEKHRQEELAGVVMRQSIAKLGYEQEASTIWDESITHSKAAKHDADWFDNNLGIWLHEYYGHDQAFILDPEGRPIYAMAGGKRAQTSSYRAVADSVRKLAGELRARLRYGDYTPAKGAQSPGAHDLVVVNGRPTIISVKPIVSDTGKIEQSPGSEHFHVSLRRIDGTLLQQLATNYWFKDAQFAWQKPGDASKAVLPLVGRNGRLVGFIVWNPFRPGAEMASRLAPALVLAFCMIGLMTIWLLLRIRRSTIELEVSEAQAQHLAFHDGLTGLPNRALFNDRLDKALLSAERGEDVALLLLDLDRFKHVNDTFGHLAGDALIREFGCRLTSVVREGDTVARLGGDEFGLILNGAGREEGVGTLCKRILSSVRTPFDVLGNQAFVGVSMGAVIAGEENAERVDLMRKADIALYRAKSTGRNRVCFFTGSMDESVKLRSTIEEELRAELASGSGLCVYYQPQVSAATSRITGVEALVRWQHPTRGLIPPEQFIPVAEDTGLISELGEWVLRQACEFSRRWPNHFTAVNLSPVQFRKTGFAERMIEIIKQSGADPRRIELEITEGVLLGDEDFVRATIKALRGAGMRLVLDDFGTGYSSLHYLRHFDFDKIKIDRSFVQHLGQTVDSGAIVTAVVTLGHAIGLKVTAEGVETPAQLRLLTSIGCDEMQGFLFSPAVTEEQIEAMLLLPESLVIAA
jgi:diguanylate cyclase (GGDEF)-like protein